MDVCPKKNCKSENLLGIIIELPELRQVGEKNMCVGLRHLTQRSHAYGKPGKVGVAYHKYSLYGKKRANEINIMRLFRIKRTDNSKVYRYRIVDQDRLHGSDPGSKYRCRSRRDPHNNNIIIQPQYIQPQYIIMKLLVLHFKLHLDFISQISSATP